MNSGTIWGQFVEKTRGKKSRATVPLNWPKLGHVTQDLISYILPFISDGPSKFLHM